MPHLSIIPASAVADSALTDAQVRVLCAIGVFTNKLGGNVWASVKTLAKACNLTERSVQRAIPVLMERGYVRCLPRPGTTNLVEICLQGVTLESPGGDTGVGGGVTLESPKRPRLNDKKNDMQEAQENQQINALARTVTADILARFPARPEPTPFPALMRVLLPILRAGASPVHLVQAAEEYAASVNKLGTASQFVRSPITLYGQGWWESYQPVPKVYGRTREEWARSGQDVAEFDRLITTLAPALLSAVSARQER